jgi:PGDYG protein
MQKDFIPFASNRWLLVVYDSSGAQNNKGCDTLIFRCSGNSGFSAEVSGHPQHVEAKKLEREVEVRFTDVDCIVRTPEGTVYAHPGDAILTGNGGHHWRVSHGKFAHKYRPVPPTMAGQSGRYVSLPYRILAVQLHAPFEVVLADQVSRLSGQPLDWLVDYGDGSLGIVAHDIFATTYEIVS